MMNTAQNPSSVNGQGTQTVSDDKASTWREYSEAVIVRSFGIPTTKKGEPDKRTRSVRTLMKGERKVKVN